MRERVMGTQGNANTPLSPGLTSPGRGSLTCASEGLLEKHGHLHGRHAPQPEAGVQKGGLHGYFWFLLSLY